jgi:hypothetical protein
MIFLKKGNTNSTPQPVRPRSSALRSRSRREKVLPRQGSDSDEADDDNDEDDDDDDEEEDVRIDNKLLGQLVDALRMISTRGTIPNTRRPRHRKSRANQDLQKEKDLDQPDERKDFLVGLTAYLVNEDFDQYWYRLIRADSSKKCLA